MAPLSTIVASAAAINLAARDFSYHDNAVRFRDTIPHVVNDFVIENESIDAGYFAVTEFSISPGQDPSGKNQIRDLHTMTMLKPETDGGYAALLDWNADHSEFPGFIFTVGRHKTAEVGNFWNARIAATQNTFAHPADEMNFAFIGLLKLETKACGHVIFPSIGLAQSSDSNGSNWWFGGRNCTHVADHKVTCLGGDGQGNTVEGDFRRGGSGQVNDVYLDACRKH